jgi:hypothetical protein
MSDDSNGKIVTLPGHVFGRADREESGVEPFLRLRYRRGGRSISRVVAIPLQPSPEGITETLELYFALG